MKSFETRAFSSNVLIIDLILIDIGMFHLPVCPCVGLVLIVCVFKCT